MNKATFLNEVAKMLRVYQEATSRTEEYQYDTAGNRKLLKVTLVRTAEFTSLYYTNSDRLKTDGKYAFAYDNAGNMVKKGNTFEISGDTVNFTTSGEDFIEGFAYGFAYGAAYEYVENNLVTAYAEGEPSKTVKTIAKKAGGCGRLFSDPDQAALDFAMRYNDDSIRSGCEYGASIFVVIDGDGTRWYTYTIPNRGVEHMVFRSFPKNRDTVVAASILMENLIYLLI